MSGWSTSARQVCVPRTICKLPRAVAAQVSSPFRESIGDVERFTGGTFALAHFLFISSLHSMTETIWTYFTPTTSDLQPSSTSTSATTTISPPPPPGSTRAFSRPATTTTTTTTMATMGNESFTSLPSPLISPVQKTIQSLDIPKNCTLDFYAILVSEWSDLLGPWTNAVYEDTRWLEKARRGHVDGDNGDGDGDGDDTAQASTVISFDHRDDQGLNNHGSLHRTEGGSLYRTEDESQHEDEKGSQRDGDDGSGSHAVDESLDANGQSLEVDGSLGNVPLSSIHDRHAPPQDRNGNTTLPDTSVAIESDTANNLWHLIAKHALTSGLIRGCSTDTLASTPPSTKLSPAPQNTILETKFLLLHGRGIVPQLLRRKEGP